MSKADHHFKGWPNHYFRGLRVYNAERARGIKHSSFTDEYMKTLQQQYDDLRRDWPVDDFDGWIVRWQRMKGVRSEKSDPSSPYSS